MEQHWLVFIIHTVVGYWTVNEPIDESITALNVVPIKSTAICCPITLGGFLKIPICETCELF